MGSSATPTKRIVRYVIEKWNRRIGLQDVLGRTGLRPGEEAVRLGEEERPGDHGRDGVDPADVLDRHERQ